MKTNLPDFSFLKTVDEREILYREKKEEGGRVTGGKQ